MSVVHIRNAARLLDSGSPVDLGSIVCRKCAAPVSVAKEQRGAALMLKVECECGWDDAVLLTAPAAVTPV